MFRFLLMNFMMMALSLSASAQDAKLLFDAQTAAPGKTVAADYVAPRIQTTTVSSSKKCTTTSQNSIPLIYVLGLLQHGPAKLIPDEGKKNETISVKGSSPIIGNCMSMITPEVTWDSDRNKYLFEVKVNSCVKDDGKCEYDVTLKDEKSGDITSKKMNFAPTMKGYFACLEATGALKDGKPNEKAINRQELSSTPVPVVVSADLLFVSRGPKAVNTGGGFYSKTNLIENDDCDYYENMSKEGYQVVSKIEIDENLLKSEFQYLCDVSQYEVIENRLKNFKEFEGMYNVLSDVRNKLLLEEVKKAKKQFDKKSKAGKLSDLDAEKFSKLMDDYNKYIIEPHFKKSKSNKGNNKLLVNLVEKYENATSDEEKKLLKAKIQKVTNELSAQLTSPYFTPNDYKKFVSVKRNAPVENPNWESASLTLQRSLVSVKMACEAYGTTSTCKSYRKDKHFKRPKNSIVSFDDVNSKIDTFAKAATRTYLEMKRLVEDPDLEISENYADRIAECNTAEDEYDQYQNNIRGLTQQMAMACQKSAKHNTILLKHCIEDGQVEIEDEQFYLEENLCSKADKTRYKQKYAEYRKKESHRDSYLDEEDDDEDDDGDDNDTGYQGRSSRKSRNSTARVYNSIQKQQNSMEFAAGIPQLMYQGMSQMGQMNRPYGNSFTQQNQQNGGGFNPQQYGYNQQYGSGYNPQQYGFGYQGMGQQQMMYGQPQRTPANFGYGNSGYGNSNYGNSGGLNFGMGYNGGMNYGVPGSMYTGNPGYTYGHSF